MSHTKERKEKTCLNCGAALSGRYCHVCGQENIEPKETVWSLIHHFFADITHFDGKFFSTSRYLLVKPGFLPAEYISGRRARYLHPIRMYVFSSAVFFLIFYTLFDLDKKEFDFEINTTAPASRPGDDSSFLDKKGDISFMWNDSNYHSVQAYDSAQVKTEAGKKDGWLKKKLTYKSIEVADKYRGSPASFWKKVLDKFIHTFPYLLFVSLPLYALFLKLLYIRQKKFYYADHGIFLIYLYIFTFIVLLILFSFSQLGEVSGWSWMRFLSAALVIYGVRYAYKAMHNFYGQSRKKTLLKFILFNVLTLVSLLMMFLVFFMISLYRI